jgi:hypothetical protein
MTISTTSTSLKCFKVLLAPLVLGILLPLISFFENNKKNTPFQLENSDLTIYLPNRVLEIMLLNKVEENKSRFFDTTSYYLAGIEATFNSEKAKYFKLLTKAKNQPHRNYGIAEVYLETQISITNENNKLNISTKSPNGAINQINNIDLNKISIEYQDKLNPVNISGKTQVLLSANSIAITFSKDTTETKRKCKFLDNSIKYQNPGISVILPHKTITAFSNSNTINLNSEDIFRTQFTLKGVKLNNTDSDNLEFSGFIDSQNEIILPAKISIALTINKINNRITSIKQCAYNRQNLSQTEIKRMENILAEIKNNIQNELSHHTLLPQMQNIPITIAIEKHRLTTSSIGDGFFTHNKNDLIATFNIF